MILVVAVGLAMNLANLQHIEFVYAYKPIHRCVNQRNVTKSIKVQKVYACRVDCNNRSHLVDLQWQKGEFMTNQHYEKHQWLFIVIKVFFLLTYLQT